MRIITGAAKGIRLTAPRGRSTRPMQDRVKEAVFSSLGDAVVEASVLDLYAGTGSMGLEALSRGAGRCVFVENDRRALEALRVNVDAVGLGGVVIPMDVGRFVATTTDRFDLAFVDPPYGLELASVEEVLSGLASTLEEGAIVVVHRHKGEPAPVAAGLNLVDERAYGGVQLWRYERVRA